MAKYGRLYNWDTIFYGHYKSVFDHCDVTSQQSNSILCYYAAQGHSRSPKSVSFESAISD